jgi:spore coat protein H
MTNRTGLRIARPVFPALLTALTMLTACRPATAAEPKSAVAVYELSKVWRVHITLPADEYAAMQPRGRGFGFGPRPAAPEKPLDPDREVHRNSFGMDLPWATGAVTIGDQTFEKVGIRYKGNGTIGDTARTIKKSFKIDLDRAGGAGRFGGSKTINLHCGVTDPSKCRETLAYELYRDAGVPASRTALAEVRLTVPGKHDNELLGIYTTVEEVGKPFLRDHFGTDKGLLMKPERLRDFEDRGDKWDAYQKAYVPKREPTAADAARVIAFARLVHKGDDAAFAKEIESYLDVDGYLRFLAVTSFLANTDSFFVLGHNYYLYLNPKTNKLHFIPWDLDRAFANFPILGSNNQQMNLSLVHPYAGTHRLTERLLAVPGVGERYRKLLRELAATCFDKERLLKRLEMAEATTKELLERDAKAASARKDGGSAFGMFGKPPALKEFIEKRTASVAAQVAETSKGYVPSGGPGGDGPPRIGPMLAGPMLASLDTDRDEKLSREEWLAAAKKLFAACEKDGDGRVDLKSLTAGLNSLFPPPPEGAPRGAGIGGFLAGPILNRADANKDGKLTSEELLTAAGAIFDEFDKRKAGKLDEETFGELLTKLFPVPNAGRPPAGPPKADG